MKKILATVFLFAFSIVLSANAQDYIGEENEIKSILTRITDFSAAYMAGDISTLASIYSEDARIMPPGAGIIQGREDIKKRWTLPEGVKILHHKATPHEIQIVENIAYDLGVYEGVTKRPDGSELSWKGKYIIIWKKLGGQWFIYADAWNRTDD